MGRDLVEHAVPGGHGEFPAARLRWDPDHRERTWSRLESQWDVVVVGGGITGAGVLRAAARLGLRAVLLEQEDFAWGASSRSTKLVHGGLRYLARGQVGVTRESVRERDALVREVPGLVAPLPVLLPLYDGQAARWLAYRSALGAYDALEGRLHRHAVDAQEVRLLVPPLRRRGLRGGLRYREAQTDDARLVLRVLREAVGAGGAALNAVRVAGLLRRDGRVCGVQVVDRLTGREAELEAAVVVNATGAWADRLRGQVGAPARMRPVRGSHLLLPEWRFPLAMAVNVVSPRDGRHVSVVPWEGATLVGTTDIDHGEVPDGEPCASADEVDYLLECLQGPFRSLELTAADVVSTWSGIRPVVSSGAVASWDESRGHAVWEEEGLLTAAGGKLTTFRVLARDVLAAAAPHLPTPGRAPAPAGPPPGVQPAGRLGARFGAEAGAVLAAAHEEDREFVAATPTTWAEVRWSLRCEAVNSLQDLMLRRTRLGLLLPFGGAEVLDRVGALCAEELGWDASRWARERSAYAARIRASHSVPPREAAQPADGGRVPAPA
ncbi:glycerol-3-phosphate dehydrogenase [Kineococcus xinjiangensis]|uniref:Glycerol-3-phosphate dehydrogenase n=1 Tax=Kineococcus xinjiangensis TaxID=512762 RepID=A0A2S6IPD0_9ACTN|nr:glycerol-3-phosphate dehydrogenase/oxidase [Kineococcus xinjiangensis]PPK96114.1 glycerol-3-phosphate dehydrogenase [Kineococcus xinjiangensis]